MRRAFAQGPPFSPSQQSKVVLLEDLASQVGLRTQVST